MNQGKHWRFAHFSIQTPGDWSLLGAGLFSLGLLAAIAAGAVYYDELFLLQVARRVYGGEVLYRDVFFGATPLAVYFSLLAVLLKSELLVLRVLNSLVFAGMGLIAFRLAQEVGLGWRSKALILLGLTAYASPWVMGTGSLYTPLSHLFLLACYPWAYHLLQRQNDRGLSGWYLACGGVLAGLSFASKQNTGVYAFLFVLFVLAWQAWRSRIGWKRWITHLLLVGSSFAGSVLLLVFLPVGLSGGLEKFLDYAFLNKVNYVAHAGISYLSYLQTWTSRTVSPSAWTGMQSVLLDVPSLFPLAAIIGLAWVWLRSRDREQDTAALLLTALVTSMGEVFPRVGKGHISCTMPIVLVSIGYAAAKAVPAVRWKNLLAALCGLWLIANLAGMYTPQAYGLVSGDYKLSRVAHFRLLLLPASTIEEYYFTQSTLVPLNGEKIFILHRWAALLYVLGDIKNPTPYDYPLVTAFGVDGQQKTLDSLKLGTIPRVCILPMNDALKPVQLEAFVLGSMQEVRDFGVCRLYRTTQSSVP